MIVREVSERLVTLSGRTYRVVAVGNGIAQLTATARRGDEKHPPTTHVAERVILDAERNR